ncbi:hypothetical protein EV143_102374 [Flavobacterium chryseum]|uniref:hypothetical protein n=1 Tax=Flavobacterium sp. P3160 TaxID=2512113 RepID=UPI00105B91C8|nr:hypothetical protein [Flavobacterium sp. P3160]TDO83110.1 hypothetical protein EV143_102374 [Flavobacterium sp. P3160]
MNTSDNNNIGTKDPRSQNLNRQNTILNEKIYDNDEMRRANHQEDIKRYGFTIRNGYDPNKAIPDQEKITTKEDDLDDVDYDFNAPGDLADDDEFDNPSDNLENDYTDPDDMDEDDENYIDDHTHTTGDILYDKNADNLNDEFDNPSDDEDLTESDNDLQELDPDDDDLEDDLEEGEIEEEDSEENYPENDPRKF